MMPPKCGIGALWSPLAPDNANAFNPCFLCMVLVVVAMATLVSGSMAMKGRRYGSFAAKNTGLVHYLRVAAVFAHTCVYIHFSVSYVNIHERFGESKMAGFWAYTLVMAFVVLPLHIVEPLIRTTASGTLLVFWPTTVLFQMALLFQDSYTEWKIVKSPQHFGQIRACELFLVANAIFVFVLEYAHWRPSKTLVYEYTKRGDAELLQEPNLIDRETFMWMNPLVRESHKNQEVVHTELPSTAGLSTKSSTDMLLKYWDPAEHNVAKSLCKAFGPLAMRSFVVEFLSRLPIFIQPQLLRILIQYFGESNPPLLKGVLIAFAMFFNTAVKTAVYNHYVLLNLELGLCCRASLTSLIYEKAMQLSTEGRKAHSSGDIINLMSVDVNKIQAVATNISTLILEPTDVLICLFSLWQLLGKATLAAVVVIVVLTPVNLVITRLYKQKNKDYMKSKDERTRLVNEIFASVKSIKLFAWEKPMLAKLSDVRSNKEMRDYYYLRLRWLGATAVWVLIPILVSLFTFSSFALFSETPLTSDIVFPALALLNMLSSPLLEIPGVITSLVEATTSLERMDGLFSSAEGSKNSSNSAIQNETQNEIQSTTPHPVVTRAEIHANQNTDTADCILLRKTSFLFSPNNYALKNVSLRIPHGTLACIVGRVGSGKTSLLSGLIGQLEVEMSDDSVFSVQGTVAYCAQQPWIMNASVKENILFGTRYDEAFYQQTIEACQLVPDLAILPDGDSTEVGEKGVSLSGGQKARLALARAVYARADIYLLDDVLSAVDSHVGKNIITKVLGKNGLLRSKTIVLATNSIPVLEHSDSISMVRDKTIVETTSFAEIDQEHHPDIYKLINEFGRRAETPDSDLTIADSMTPVTSRRASVATFTWEPIKKLLPNLRSGQENEKSAKGSIKWSVYVAYFQACSLVASIFFVCLLTTACVLSVYGNYWLKRWAESNASNDHNKDVWRFIIGYAAIGLASSASTVLRTYVLTSWIAIRASIKIHDDMARRVLNAPMAFFERTPIGRIMNRFTNDIQKIDGSIPSVMGSFLRTTLSTAMTLVVVSYAMPFYIIVIVSLSSLYWYYEQYYVSISRSLKRLVSVSRSPIYAHLGESLNGIDTIHAYNQVDRFDYINRANVDFNLKAVYTLRSIGRWLNFRLQYIGSLGVLFATLLAVHSLTTSHPLSPSTAGFVMSYVLSVTTTLRVAVQMTAEVENNVVAMERCLEYCELPVEEEAELEARLIKPPPNWTHNGSIVFHNYSARYRENLDLILNNISLEFKKGEKIGVVGRTGAGKSSLVLALFRIIEAAEGFVEIDGLKTSSVSLFNLRRNLGIIPQDSQLIEGTLRQNLDPFNYYTDSEIWNALELAHLKAHIVSMEDPDNQQSKLDLKVQEGGSNFSSGQRQLISLARVLLRMRDANILVLDEATAAIDVETDKIIQETIRKEFKSKTIITIAHRLETVFDSDKIVALDKGRVMEFDTPSKLLEQKGIFYGLCREGGLV